MNIGKCRDCGQSVIWSRTTKGANVALNPLQVWMAVRIFETDDEGPIELRAANSVHLDTCVKRGERKRA